jgi:hypothetical protein
MNRYNDILNQVQESLEAVQKTYKGQKRSDLKDSDFLFPENRSFPIVSPTDIPDAISNFGRMKNEMSYDTFLSKLYKMAKRKGPEFVAALPKAAKIKLNIVKSKSNDTTDDMEEDDEEDDMKMELNEYKKDFLNMNIGSLKAIMQHAASILKSVEENDPLIKNNLTESWLQGKIAITEDYMRTIHDFVKYVPDNDDKSIAGCGCGKNKPKPTQPQQENQTKPQTQNNEPKGHTHQAKTN